MNARRSTDRPLAAGESRQPHGGRRTVPASADAPRRRGPACRRGGESAPLHP
ncbi:hypothetical protein C7S16_3426 [Burkholderia thailandensis]|uniref:Uncharacterized protein n=1 Tax=Burkholderia thailandensis TaxID=57975 RepID=A0AAW9CZ56_BURTH|nr:hypothetical protein [Burkholderia thailandensis]MDW9254956.1 hypothetical protein [Burkholderia thailandensis]